MRIALLHDDPPSTLAGGAGAAVARLRAGLCDAGHDVTLIITHRVQESADLRTSRDTLGVIHSIPTTYDLRRRHWRCLQNPDVTPHLRRLLEELRPDAVHVHNVHTYLGYDCLRIAASVTKNVILTAHDTFLVSFGRVGGDRYASAALRGEPIRLNVVDHVRAVGRRYNPLRNRGIRSALADSGATVVAVSHVLEQFLRTNGIERTTTIHNGVDAASPIDPAAVASFRTRFHLSGPVVLFGGRVSADKGIEAFFAAMQRVPSATIMLTGAPERSAPFLRRASAELQQRTRVTGFLSDADLQTAFHAADIVTTPSLYLDAFNLMNIEAMNVGKPVVGTRFGGTVEIVEDDVTGILVDPRDTVAYASALERLLGDAELRKRMGEAGRQRIAAHFTVSQQVERYMALYG